MKAAGGFRHVEQTWLLGCQAEKESHILHFTYFSPLYGRRNHRQSPRRRARPHLRLNASLAGWSQRRSTTAAWKNLRGLHGVQGLKRSLLSWRRNRNKTFADWLYAGGPLGTTRSSERDADLERCGDGEAHNIRFFQLYRRSEAMQCVTLHDLAAARGYASAGDRHSEGVDNTLGVTDHCPGYEVWRVHATWCAS